MKNRITPKEIINLKENQIFVFGSNMAGRHGAGAALKAVKDFGANYGQAFGLQGRSFAIPTKNYNISAALDIDAIEFSVLRFIDFAIKNPHLTFLVTEIGCGLAGLRVEDVAVLFKDAIPVENIHLPKRFWFQLLDGCI